MRTMAISAARRPSGTPSALTIRQLARIEPGLAVKVSARLDVVRAGMAELRSSPISPWAAERPGRLAAYRAGRGRTGHPCDQDFGQEPKASRWQGGSIGRLGVRVKAAQICRNDHFS